MYASNRQLPLCVYSVVLPMEEPGEQCTVVFPFVVTEPASECDSVWRRGALPPSPVAGCVTIYYLCKDDSGLFPRFLRGAINLPVPATGEGCVG
jgi:hypothetical protein